MKEDKGLEKLRINYCKGETAFTPCPPLRKLAKVKKKNQLKLIKPFSSLF